MKIAAAVLAVLCTAVLAGCGAETAKEETPAAPAAPAAAKTDGYPLTTCPVSGEKLGGMGDPFVFTYEGQEVRLCCPKCKKEFDKDPAKYMAKIEAAKKK